jgi:hypothetical protein
MSRETRKKAHSTDILDYPSNLSMIDKEELVAKAKLKAEKRVIARPRRLASTKQRPRFATV